MRWIEPAAFLVVLLLALAAVVEGAKPLPLLDSFRRGMDGYAGAVDAEIEALAPTAILDTKILDTNPNATSDANNDGGESQTLPRLDGIRGTKQGQLPPQVGNAGALRWQDR